MSTHSIVTQAVEMHRQKPSEKWKKNVIKQQTKEREKTSLNRLFYYFADEIYDQKFP